MANDLYRYQGKELDVFAHAKRWKTYWTGKISKSVFGDVLEVGAGLGVNTKLLQSSQVRSWHCLEPDPTLSAQLAIAVAHVPACSVGTGVITDLPEGSSYDTILYIDVLEHIEADRNELADAVALLRPGGYLIVLSPAHQFLFSAFDREIGHYRRYNRASLSACSPPNCALISMFYLDSAGMLASLANRLLLQQRDPTESQIRFWDQRIIPISTIIDPVLRYKLGKTIIAIWHR